MLMSSITSRASAACLSLSQGLYIELRSSPHLYVMDANATVTMLKTPTIGQLGS